VPPYRISWTNKSVLKFAGNSDPIDLIEAKARALVLRARDAGWSGPPYNPLAIADLLKIPVEANSEVADARTVPSGMGIKIEFNPTRPRERVRFSLAHEIAHTLFADVADQTRHRGGTPTSPDEWQLEMLCNLAAAEFVMPLGSLPASDRLPKLEQLMADRRKFDVSAEAFLIRVVKTTAEPALMFCASPIEDASLKPSYRIDYTVGSKSAPPLNGAGISVPSDSIVNTCTAIGQTNRASESWLTEERLIIECVGIPGFPGTIFPRIAGIIRFRGEDAEQDGLNFRHGDVLSPGGPGMKVVCQLVNDQARVWGGGVLLEGTQGTSLSLHHGIYPWVTSRETSVAGCLADAGIASTRVRRVIMVCRTYPIRVGGPSGPMELEIEYEELARRSGIDIAELKKTETTTTTRRQRRLAEFDWEQLHRSTLLNGPTDIALTFVDYLSKANRDAFRFDQLKPETTRFIEEVERVSGVPVSLISTSFNWRNVIDRRSW